MKVFLTGAAGRIGREVLKELRNRQHEVISFDILTNNSVEGAVAGDLANLSNLTSLMRGIDCVVHLAAIPDYNTKNNKLIWDTNSTGTFNILEAAIRNDVKKIVYASSICAIGFIYASQGIEPDYFPVDEKHPCRPDDAYGISKFVGESLCLAYSKRYGITTICLRFATVWFPSLPISTIDKIKKIDKPETLSHFIWNWIDLRDATKAIILSVETTLIPSGQHEIFNIGSNHTCSSIESLELINRFYPNIKMLKNTGGFLSDKYAALFSPYKAKLHLGFLPKHKWIEYVEAAKKLD